MTNLNVWLQTTELKLCVPVPLPHCSGNGAPRLLPATHPGRLSHALYLRISISSQRRAPANTCPACFPVQIKSPTGPEGQCWEQSVDGLTDTALWPAALRPYRCSVHVLPKGEVWGCQCARATPLDSPVSGTAQSPQHELISFNPHNTPEANLYILEMSKLKRLS